MIHLRYAYLEPIQQLLGFLRALRAQDASVAPQVTHLVAAEQVRRLRDGELDLGIFYHVEDYDELELEPLYPGEPLVAYLPPEHRLAERQVLRPGDLIDEELVMFARTMNPPLHDRLLSMLEDSGYHFRSVREGNGENWRDLLVAVAGGLGVAFLPYSLKEASEAGDIVTLRPLEPQLRMPDTVVAWRADPPRQLQATLEAVREIARELRRMSAA